ncbi:hypothetical protein K2X89_09155, partial [Myxococcota bacterium]|nr:hypothetical protein [Myxococcota bacterium]
IVEILLALDPELAGDALEGRISRAASEILHHLEAGHRVGLRTRSARFAPERGAAHRRALLDFLARVEPEPERERAGTPEPAPVSGQRSRGDTA